MRFPGHSTNWPRDFRRLPAGVQLQTSRASNRSSRLFYMWHQAITAYLKCSSLDPDRNLHALVFHSVISAPGPWFPATPGLIPITLNCTAYTASQSTLTFGPENPSTFHLRLCGTMMYGGAMAISCKQKVRSYSWSPIFLERWQALRHHEAISFPCCRLLMWVHRNGGFSFGHGGLRFGFISPLYFIGKFSEHLYVYFPKT